MDGRRGSDGGGSRALDGGVEERSNRAPAAEGVLDLEVLARLEELGGEDEPELVPDLIHLFLSDAHHRLSEMRLALHLNDHAAVARMAHTLKSSAGSMGAVLLSDICREIEEIARDCAKGDLASGAQRCFDAYERTEKALKEIQE